MTYNVFLVEDEVLVRKNICENSIWQDSEFRLCGNASNGRDALAKLTNINDVDIIITDIRMPLMDGLAFTKEIKAIMPKVHVIILSGYGEFKYAQQAMTLGVTEYLMKPVTPSELLEVLIKTAKKIDDEREIHRSLEELNILLIDSQRRPVQKFLCALSTGLLDKAAIENAVNHLNINLSGDVFCGIVVDISACIHNDDQYLDLLDFTGYYWSPSEGTYYFFQDDSTLCFLLSGNSDAALKDKVSAITAEFQRHLSQCNICSGDFCNDITGLWYSYSSAVTTLRSMHSLTNGSIMNTASMNNGPSPISSYDINVYKELILNLLKYGEVENVDGTIQKIRKSLSHMQCSNMFFMYSGIDICLAVKNFITAICSSRASDFDSIINPMLSSLSTLYDVQLFLDMLSSLLKKAIEFRNSMRADTYIDEIEESKRYIELHFEEPDLSLSAVADQAHISPAYFSSLFSHATGDTFVSYLTTVRINKAKELLKTTGLHSSDIAYEVGYNDPNHFRKMFKRTTGLSPKEYRLSSPQA